VVSQLSLLDWAGLAAMATGAPLLYTLTGFGFAVLSTPAFLLFVDPPQAIQLVIIISTALSITALPGLWRAIAPALLLRLTPGSYSRVAAQAHCPPRRRSGGGPPVNRSRDPGLNRGHMLGPALRTGQPYGSPCHETRPRSRSRGDFGDRNCARRNGGPAGPDLFAARPSTSANRPRDAALIFRDRLRGGVALPCGRCRHRS
jgi:hypothetical protein